MRPLPAGRLLASRYQIVRALGAGGTGEVYEARDIGLGVTVALKTLSRELAADGVALERFRREIQSARRITHPNVCRIFDLGVEQGEGGQRFFFTMELLAGQSLAERLAGGRALPPDEALPIAAQIADGLQAAHDAGVLHRDLKPGNVMLSPTPAPGAPWPVRATIMDFGIALSEEMIGTPAYMAPEQAAPGPLGPAADVYALGLIAYEMLAGRGPFDPGPTPLATVLRRKHEPPRPLRQLAPHVEPAWEAAIHRCLERDPGRRFARAADFGQALLGRAASDKRRKR